MRFLLLMFLFCAGLFSAQITPEQIQLIQQAGYSQEDLSKALSNTTKEEVDSKKEQIVQNVVVKEVPKEQSTSSSISRYASQFFNNKNS